MICLQASGKKKCFIIISPLSSDFLALALSCDGFAMAGKGQTVAMQVGRRGGRVAAASGG